MYFYSFFDFFLVAKDTEGGSSLKVYVRCLPAAHLGALHSLLLAAQSMGHGRAVVERNGKTRSSGGKKKKD